MSFLDYPCTCIRLLALWVTTSDDTAIPPRRPRPVLKEVGKALSWIMGMVREMQAPHNVA